MIDRHHKLAKHKNRRRRYGELIHGTVNIELSDHDRHMSGKVSHLNEREFCQASGILDCKYCHNILTDGSCLWKRPGVTCAVDCRFFLFNKDKFYIDK
jgi:hypothetical protein